MSIELKKEIERIKELNYLSLKETTTQTVSVIPMLRTLGWDTQNPDEVSQEHKAGGRVDIVLRIDKEPVVFIETKPGKQRRLTEGDKKQLLRYCKNRIRLGVLTNGFVWYLYPDAEAVTTKPNDYAVEINFNGSIEENAKIFMRFLSSVQVRYHYESVLDALSDKRIGRVLAEKWEGMLQRGHERLARALWDEVKNELSTGQGSLDRVRKFIRQRSNAPESKEPDPVSKRTRRASRPRARVARSNQRISQKMKDLLKFLQKEPQATYARIAEVLGGTRGGASAAVKRAEDVRHIRKSRRGRTCIYQVLVDPDSGVKSQTKTRQSQLGTKKRSMLKVPAVEIQSVQRKSKSMSETTKRLLALLIKEPSATYARIAEVLGMTRGGVSVAVKRAEDIGHIRKSKQGRVCTYTVLTNPNL